MSNAKESDIYSSNRILVGFVVLFIVLFFVIFQIEEIHRDHALIRYGSYATYSSRSTEQ